MVAVPVDTINEIQEILEEHGHRRLTEIEAATNGSAGDTKLAVMALVEDGKASAQPIGDGVLVKRVSD